MQLLLNPAPATAALMSRATATAEALRVFIAFDDMLAYKCALHTIEHVARQLHEDLDLQPQPCPFDVIESAYWRRRAADEMGDSEIVVISTSHAGSLPQTIREWLQACCHANRDSGALLVAMLGALEDDCTSGARDTEFLRRLAEDTGWEFLTPRLGHTSPQPCSN